MGCDFSEYRPVLDRRTLMGVNFGNEPCGKLNAGSG